MGISNLSSSTNRQILIKQWFDEYYYSMLSYARRLTLDKHNAEDACQTVFLNLSSNDSLDFNYLLNTETSLAFLLKSVKNACLDQIKRKKAKKRSVVLVDISQLDFAQKNDSSFQLINNEEFWNLLNTIVKEPESQALKLLLHGYSYEEIANEINISVAAVRKRIFRARKKICRSGKRDELIEALNN